MVNTKRLFNTMLWAGWFLILALPFMGMAKASVLAVIIFAAMCAAYFAKTVFRQKSFFSFEKSIATIRKSLDSILARKKVLLIALLFCFLIPFPFFSNNYFIDVATTAGIYIVLALGLNIVVGYTGLLVLGYSAFYAVGAYSYALLSTEWHVSFWVGLVAGGIFSAFSGVVLGLPVIRLRGDYLAIVTLGFGEMVRLLLNNMDEVTGGPNGILGIAKPAIFGFEFHRPIHFYYLILIFIVLVVFIVHRLNNSRIGRAWVAIREDEVAAQAMGINIVALKLLAFLMSAGVAGIMGVFFASRYSFVSPESFTFLESVMVLAMVILGGMGSIPGVITGAVILVVLPELLRGLALYRMLIFGILMVTMMRWRPQGLIPSSRRTLELKKENVSA